MSLISKKSARRGDTLIEVMFAVGVFALVAIISVSVMNSGVNNAERDLELVTARNELNAQAEALRFIHSSYIAEKTLPVCTPQIISTGEKCQQYKTLWEKIISNAVDPSSSAVQKMLDSSNFRSCTEYYEVPAGSTATPLGNAKAFVINTRRLWDEGTGGYNNSNYDVNLSYIFNNQTFYNTPIFRPADINSRIIYSNYSGVNTSEDQMVESTRHDYAASVEGIWDFAVTDGTSNPKYYDFYIQTCWYGPRATAPSFLDTVIRLYNPENI